MITQILIIDNIKQPLSFDSDAGDNKALSIKEKLNNTSSEESSLSNPSNQLRKYLQIKIEKNEFLISTLKIFNKQVLQHLFLNNKFQQLRKANSVVMFRIIVLS
ncbi:unnamed protein product [Paramecium sonneborni]|uniref:Uncharacterized protein n=1 Tax=Paramecium sonneborni TaxID=65129 RepID=A0A8S1RPQ2_9CILI|nr:unnamed protein product [Paramecium sonneborni]